MPRNSSVTLDTSVVTRVFLWATPVVIASIGFVVLASSNAAQAAFYASRRGGDYGAYFAAQSGSILGSILIGAGALGLIVALATQVHLRASEPPAPEATRYAPVDATGAPSAVHPAATETVNTDLAPTR